MPKFPGGVYAITPETADTERLLQQVEAARLRLPGLAADLDRRGEDRD